jgi:sulfite reductase (NADPH) hemoprotein beta-component
MAETEDNLSPVEIVKAASRLLRGSLVESLADPITGAIAEDDTHVSKFHGIYQQDDRDIRAERQKQKLEPAYSFMIRARVPGGIATAEQWLAMDRLAREYANGTLRITTRQAFQLHGVLKSNLKTAVAGINASLLDTLAACGDVNRNVMCTPVTDNPAVYTSAQDWARRISDHLTPRTNAYHEIWLDGEKVSGPEAEPIYGATYLPRKFKISVAIPPTNDTDVFAQDLGFIAIARGDKLLGFNVTVGGGMGATHNEPETYPRTADVIGFCTPSQTLAVAETVVAIQRDHGDRGNRKHARLKYTIDDRGLDWFITELGERLGFTLQPAAAFEFDHNGDRFGWWQDSVGHHHLGLFVPGGRVADLPDDTSNGRGGRWLTGLASIAAQGLCEFRLTPNQHLILANISASDKEQVAALVDAHQLNQHVGLSPTRLNALACVAFPTCGLAMAEAERYLPDFLDGIEERLRRHGLEDESISVRITGCPNGCARPYLADIGLVGKAPGRYALRLGGGDAGRRLNHDFLENANEATILDTLDELFGRFSAERESAEDFGGFFNRVVLAGGTT